MAPRFSFIAVPLIIGNLCELAGWFTKVDNLSKHAFIFRWIVGTGSHAGIYPKSRELRKEIVERLQDVEGIKVYGKHDIPEELHYKHNKNSPPILVMAEPGTIILSSGRNVQRPSYNRGGGKGHGYSSPQSLVEQTKMGLSGYDPKEPDMRGIFLAKGPGT